MLEKSLHRNKFGKPSSTSYRFRFPVSVPNLNSIKTNKMVFEFEKLEFKSSTE